MQQNPGLFQQLMRQWNMSQPLPGRDPRHIEWTGPNPQYHPPDTQTAGGDGNPQSPERQPRVLQTNWPPDNPPLPRSRPATADAPPPTPPETAPPAADPAAPDLSSMFAGADDTEEDDSAVA
jgi:hypothetical protein